MTHFSPGQIATVQLKNAPPKKVLILTPPDSESYIEAALLLSSISSTSQVFHLQSSDWSTHPLHDLIAISLRERHLYHTTSLTPTDSSLTTSALLRYQKKLILTLTQHYSHLAHTRQRPGYQHDAPPFTPHQDTIPYAGRVFDAAEVTAAVNSILDFWLTLGPEGEAFETELAQYLGVKRSLLVNSGSSANLLALSALTSPKLPPERRILPGDEVITTAAGFPTTVAPIIQCGAIPVFLDNDPLTLNADLTHLEEAHRPGKTKAVIMAHTLGNPFDLDRITDFCQKHNLWLIEDNCDALGARYAGRLTGTWGDLSTQSFYPPHHLTMGEGGAVNIVRDMKLKVLVESFRDWGRDCWCPSGKDNTCNKRFGWQLGELPQGYDHKYIYSHLGYNLKPLDPQAAIARQQLLKLPHFIQARQHNWLTLRQGLHDLSEFFDFHLPTHAKDWSPQTGFTWHKNKPENYVQPSWFGFMLLVKPNAPFTRTELARHLDQKKIGNRMLFGGNLLRQPAFVQLRKERPESIRIIGDLKGADRILNHALFIGVYPGLTPAMLDYMIEAIHDFVRSR
ncbi:MAG: lipopolysaccharide biosynthesis protein RfbH [Methylacidiphilales bacterium]|nr:lipopolysaccharide biosynthesis protein RfbH [Candidatus Methylacidiphilales bacterium]MDW8349240.1 lipopolysaccharide biosynthesis protein RfbH [Verrucomicrobiae bacterium]